MPRRPDAQERLTAEAADLADEVGFAQVTVAALAKRLGVTEAAVYARAGNSRAIKTRIAVDALRDLADRASIALAGRSGRDALAAYGDTFRDYAHAHPGRYAAAQFDLDPGTAAASAAPQHSRMMRAVLRGYDLAEPDETDAVRLIGSTFHGYIDLERSGGFAHTARSGAASWERVVDALDAVLRNWPEPRV